MCTREEVKLVSIIVPVFQAEKYIDRCVLSLINQTYTEIEILLIDDGSKDKSFERCKFWENLDSRIIVFQHENHGVSYTRNVGIDNARGKYVIFLDADDELEKNAIKDMVLGIEDNHVDVCISGYCIIKKEKKINFLPEAEGKFEKKQIEVQFWDLFEKHILHNIGTKMYKKSILDAYNIRFHNEYTVCEDIRFCLDYIEKMDSLYILKKTYYHYMQDNDNSVNKQYRYRFLENEIELNDYLNTVISTKNEKYYKNILLNLYGAVLNEFENPKSSREDIRNKIKMVCENKVVVSTRDRFELKQLSMEEKLFCIFLWKKKGRLIYILAWMKSIKKKRK